MAAAIFPAYALARIVVSPPWAYFAAVGAIAAPALSYAPILVEEPWAYPAATLALWLTVRAIDRPEPRSVALAFGACLLAVLIRSQLAALLGALAFGLLVLGWRTETMRRWRTSWTRWDWVGAVVLGVGAVIALVAFLGHRSNEWEAATTLWKGRMVEYGSWAGGAFAIGVGVLPAIALLAVLAVPGSERARPGVRAFVVVAGGAVVSFGWYAAIKGAYLSTQFSSLIVERNLVYLTPLAFVATAYLLERAAARVWAVLVGRGGRARDDRLGPDRPRPRQLPVLRGARALDPRAREPRVGVAARADRHGAGRRSRSARAALLLALGTSLRTRVAAVVVGVRVAGRDRGRRCSPGTSPPRSTPRSASTTSALASRRTSRSRTTGSTAPPATGPSSYLSQRMTDDPIGANATEFWNRSIVKVWSVDGTGPGPGPHAHARPGGRRRHALARSRDRLRARGERRRGGR